MTLSASDVWTAYLGILLRQFEYDVSVMSQPWMYVWCFIPIACYLVFFAAKWLVLTAPITGPIGILIAAFRKNGR